MRERQPSQREIEGEDDLAKQKSWIREHVKGLTIAAAVVGIGAAVGERIINPNDAESGGKQDKTEQIAQVNEAAGERAQFEVPENPEEWTATLDADSTEEGPDPDNDQEAEGGPNAGEMRTYTQQVFKEFEGKYPQHDRLLVQLKGDLDAIIDYHVSGFTSSPTMETFKGWVDTYSDEADTVFSTKV